MSETSTTVDPDSGETIPDGLVSPFPNPGEVALDHAAQASSRIISQYKGSTKLSAVIALHAGLFQRIDNFLVSIPPLDDPAIAGGVNLVITAELVGQPSVLLDGTDLTLNETLFRACIALRIIRNHAVGSGSEMDSALATILGGPPFNSSPLPFRYLSFGGLATGIEVGTGAPPDSKIIALLDPDNGLIPLDMAVGFGRAWYDPTDYFAFNGDTGSGAKGFGLTSDPTKGGKFAMRF